MITDKDVAKLEKKFVTKKDLQKTVDTLIEYIDTSNQAQKKEIIEEMGGQTKQFTKEVSSILQNHETRIRTLESDNLN